MNHGWVKNMVILVSLVSDKTVPKSNWSIYLFIFISKIIQCLLCLLGLWNSAVVQYRARSSGLVNMWASETTCTKVYSCVIVLTRALHLVILTAIIFPRPILYWFMKQIKQNYNYYVCVDEFAFFDRGWI